MYQKKFILIHKTYTMRQVQENEQKTIQIQWQYLSRGLNSLLNSLNRLNSLTEDELPESYEQALKSSPQIQSEIDNCITEVLASVLEVKHRETLSVIKKRVATRVLEWLSLRKNTKPDIVDELCTILLYNCVDIQKEVPERIQKWDGKITEDELKEFAGGLMKAGHDLKINIEDEKKGRSPMLDELDKLKDLDYKNGIVRLQHHYPALTKELTDVLA
jgi:hypothetical protein